MNAHIVRTNLQINKVQDNPKDIDLQPLFDLVNQLPLKPTNQLYTQYVDLANKILRHIQHATPLQRPNLLEIFRDLYLTLYVISMTTPEVILDQLSERIPLDFDQERSEDHAERSACLAPTCKERSGGVCGLPNKYIEFKHFVGVNHLQIRFNQDSHLEMYKAMAPEIDACMLLNKEYEAPAYSHVTYQMVKNAYPAIRRLLAVERVKLHFGRDYHGLTLTPDFKLYIDNNMVLTGSEPEAVFWYALTIVTGGPKDAINHLNSKYITWFINLLVHKFSHR